MFGMWCIVSAPLVLSFDVTVGEVVDAVWPILSNSEAVSINQRWEGSPGRLLLTDRKGLQEPNAAGFVRFPGQLGQARGWQNVPGDTGPVGWQVGDCVDEWTGGACSEHYMVLNIENMTLGEADAWCGDEPLCGGFSYRNGTTGSAAVDEKVREIYFKGADEVFFMDGCGNSARIYPNGTSTGAGLGLQACLTGHTNQGAPTAPSQQLRAIGTAAQLFNISANGKKCARLEAPPSGLREL